MLSTGDIKEIEWVSKELQLTDCLIKSGASPNKLLNALSGNGLFYTADKKSLNNVHRHQNILWLNQKFTGHEHDVFIKINEINDQKKREE